MVKVMSRKDTNVNSFVNSDERLRNARMLGRGSFSQVFDTPDPARVFKLTADAAHTSYLLDCYSPQGPFKPVVYEDYGVVCTTKTGIDVYLLEMERLHKVRRGTPNGRLVRQIVHFVRLRTYWDRQLPMVEDDLTWLPAELADFMGELNYFVWNFNWALDIGWQNFMERADGTLVLSDPVIDYETYQAHVH